jgi:polar amino acid transport system substrate-binding protein
MNSTLAASRVLHSRFRVPALAATAALLLAVTACSPSTTATSSNTPESTGVPALAVNEAAANLLPASIKSSKVLNVAIPTNEPPTQYYQVGTQNMTGINPDIARLIGEALGVTVNIKVANFSAIIPGIAAGRYDMTVSSMTPTTERMQVLDFVDYMQVGNAIAVAQGNPEGINKDTMCGKKVGLLTGSYQLTVDIPTLQKACQTAGKPQIQTNEFQDTRQAISALTSGRLDAVLADSPILNFAAKADTQIFISDRYEFAPVSVGVPKESGLVKSLSAALDDVIKSSAYHETLAKYGVESAAITDARVNFAQ